MSVLTHTTKIIHKLVQQKASWLQAFPFNDSPISSAPGKAELYLNGYKEGVEAAVRALDEQGKLLS